MQGPVRPLGARGGPAARWYWRWHGRARRRSREPIGAGPSIGGTRWGPVGTSGDRAAGESPRALPSRVGAAPTLPKRVGGGPAPRRRGAAVRAERAARTN